MLDLFHTGIDDKRALRDHSTPKFHGCGPATNSKYNKGDNAGAKDQMALYSLIWRDGGVAHPTFS
jgi:hypothetical protein